MIRKLSGTAPEPYWPVDRQSAGDIMREMVACHVECQEDYDKIVGCLNDADDLYKICYQLWKFCRTNFTYVIESGEQQNISCPYTILTGGKVDCKNYALFCAGMLAALKRKGYPLSWCFRFASYEMFDPAPGHVFVVVNKDTDNIWVDPVLSPFDYHMPYLWHKDKRPKQPSRVGAIGYARIGSPETDLLSKASEYQQGLLQAVTLSSTTSTMNTITAGLVMGITTVLVPGLGAALKVLSLAQAPLNNAFGVGSVGARVYSDITSFNVVGLVSDIFNGRTYDSDQYWGAALYYFYVEGKDITNQDQVADSMVWPALKWFIDRTGVFISGRQHIMGLLAGASTYTAYAKVNSYTTTNAAQVQAAVEVAQKYWPINGAPSKDYESFPAGLKGSWANTVGVFDTGLTTLAASFGETAETYAAQTGDQYATNENEGLPATTSPLLGGESIIPGVPNIYLIAGFAVIAVIGLTSKK